MKRQTLPFLFVSAFLALLAIPAAGQLVYQTNTANPTVFAPGSTINLPNANPGLTSSLTIRIVNVTGVVQTVNSIASSGASFSLTQVPALPALLGPGASIVFTINFTPSQAGTATGSLAINSDTFTLSGVGTAAQLVFSYQAAGTTITIGATNTSVVFSPVTITKTAQITFSVRNGGTLPVVISNIGVGQAIGAGVGTANATAFTVTGLPNLPTSLAAGSDFSFTIAFQPTVLGFSNAVLQVDTNAIPLIGSGTAPPAIPAYTITGATSPLTPKGQPKVSLTLASAYPIALTGVLNMAVTGALPADPAVQFATGGRTVPFAIPANSTSAIFGPTGATIGTSVGFQSGTVADTITFSPTFATKDGGIDMTPAAPTTLQLALPTSAPVLAGLQLANATSVAATTTAAATNSFSLAVTGYATARSLTRFSVQFTMTSGYTMPQTQFTVDLTSASAIWFQSATSQAFGGQFIVTVPFTFNGTLPSGASIQNAFSSVSVTVANPQGTSNAVQANF